MENSIPSVWNGQLKVGVLGAGQLGKMMALEAANWHLSFYMMDKQDTYPAAPYGTHFVVGDFKNEADVLRFGTGLDVLTVEIEHVHIGALKQLQSQGVRVYPQPEVLELIIDKGHQKQFYQDNNLPTASFQLFENKLAIQKALKHGELSFPFVQKTRTGGYDGKGVAVIKNESDLDAKLLAGPSMIEGLVDIEMELAVIVARSSNGECVSYPVVEMVFDAEANLVDYLFAPSSIAADLQQKAREIAEKTAEKLDVCGLLAVELFLTKNGEILINEVAPRPHNSGHHTIESCPTSQFAQHLRAILGLPLGDTHLLQPSVMLNILGAPGFQGAAIYKGMDEVLSIPNVFVHLYGKKETRPARKMGHITLLASTLKEALGKARKAKSLIKCESSKSF